MNKKDKIKILHITQSLGGVGSYIQNIIPHIDKTKFELVLLTPFNQELNSFCLQNDIKIYNKKMARGINPYLDICNIFEYINIIKKEKPNIVHLHSSKAGFIGRIVCKITSRKSIFTPHGLSYLSFTGIKRIFFFLLEVFVKPITNHVLTCSYSETTRMISELGYKQNKVSVFLNSIPLTNKNISGRKKIDSSQQIKIGTIARLTHQKNPLLFIEIANAIIQKYPNTEFSILGSGLEDHLMSDVINLIKKYNISDKIHILPWGNKNESMKYLQQLDIFLLTSIFEGLPLSLLEAMANEIPVIVSKCDGCNDVVQNNENGFTCITKDEFVEKIDFFINNPQASIQIGINGRKYVEEHHNISNTIHQLEEYYNTIDKMA